MKKISGFLCILLLLLFTMGSAKAVLVDNGGGLIYDTDLNITWYDEPAPLRRSWQDALDWAAGLTIGGVNGWRLPSALNMDGTTGDPNNHCTVVPVVWIDAIKSELGHLYYIELGNQGCPYAYHPMDCNNNEVNMGPFKNAKGAWGAFGYVSWALEEHVEYYNGSCLPYTNRDAWYFYFPWGNQGYSHKSVFAAGNYALAVHSGNVHPNGIDPDPTPSLKLGLYSNQAEGYIGANVVDNVNEVSGIVADGTQSAFFVAKVTGLTDPDDYKVIFRIANANPDHCGGSFLHMDGGSPILFEAVLIPTMDTNANMEIIYEAIAAYYTPRWWSYELKDDEVSATLVRVSTGEEVVSSEFKNLNLRPCPVFLVHGLWSSAQMWEELSVDPEPYSFKDYLIFWLTEQFNYAPYTNPLPGNWIYPYNYLWSNFRGFAFNTGLLKVAVRNYIQNLRESGFALNKIDVVAHSMGGILVRKAGEDPSWDYIHKLITIDTPHKGATSADILIQNRNLPVSGALSFELLMAINGKIIRGAVDDLATNSIELPRPTPKIPGYAIVGTPGQPGLVDITLLSSTPTEIKALLIAGQSLLFPFWKPLDFQAEKHDYIVQESSQIGGVGSSSYDNTFSTRTSYWHNGIYRTHLVRTRVLELLLADPNSFGRFQ